MKANQKQECVPTHCTKLWGQTHPSKSKLCPPEDCHQRHSTYSGGRALWGPTLASSPVRAQGLNTPLPPIQQ